jgi:hypothetical protein
MSLFMKKGNVLAFALMASEVLLSIQAKAHLAEDCDSRLGDGNLVVR